MCLIKKRSVFVWFTRSFRRGTIGPNNPLRYSDVVRSRFPVRCATITLTRPSSPVNHSAPQLATVRHSGPTCGAARQHHNTARSRLRPRPTRRPSDRLFHGVVEPSLVQFDARAVRSDMCPKRAGYTSRDESDSRRTRADAGRVRVGLRTTAAARVFRCQWDMSRVSAAVTAPVRLRAAQGWRLCGREEERRWTLRVVGGREEVSASRRPPMALDRLRRYPKLCPSQGNKGGRELHADISRRL